MYDIMFCEVQCSSMLKTVKTSSMNKNPSFRPNPYYQTLPYLHWTVKMKWRNNNLLVRKKSRRHIYREFSEESTLLLILWKEGWTTQVGRIWEHAPFYLKWTCILLSKKNIQKNWDQAKRNTSYFLNSWFKNSSKLDYTSRNCLREWWSQDLLSVQDTK